MSEESKDVETVAVDNEYLVADVMACTSAIFYRWVLEFNGKVKIVGPKHVAEAYRDKLRKALESERIINM